MHPRGTVYKPHNRSTFHGRGARGADKPCLLGHTTPTRMKTFRLLACVCCLTHGIRALQSEKHILDLARGINDLSTLVTTLTASNLATALQGNGPFTVFAPSNAAFEKLPPAALNRLLQPQNKDELVGILAYHVLSGSAIYSNDLSASQEVKTLQGQDLLVEFTPREQIKSDIEKAILIGVPLWCVILCLHRN